MSNPKENEGASRIDLLIADAYKNSSNIAQFRQRFLSTWRQDPRLSAGALSQIGATAHVSAEEDNAAMMAITDYFMEPYFLPTMSIEQANAYFVNLDRT